LDFFSTCTFVRDCGSNIHKRKITSIRVIPNQQKFCSSSLDKTIHLYDLTKGTCITTFMGHHGGINCLELVNENLIMSGSNDKSIKLWDLRTDKIIGTLKGHVCPIKCIKSNESKMVSGASDNIKIWDIRNLSGDNQKCLKSLDEHKATAINFTENLLLSGDSSGQLGVFYFS